MNAEQVAPPPPTQRPKRVFFDTEFTGLHADAKLISIGLVSDEGRRFYAELSDTYVPEECSAFCRDEVLLHLEHGTSSAPLADVSKRLNAWLQEEGEHVILVSDSSRDGEQLAKLFPNGLPPNCSYRVLGWWGNLRRRVVNAGRRLHRKHGLRVHHALDDALVNRLALTGLGPG